LIEREMEKIKKAKEWECIACINGDCKVHVGRVEEETL